MPIILLDGSSSESSSLTICNLALSMLGENSITQAQLDAESTKAAELCARFYPYVRDQVLEAHPWNFAEKHRLMDYTDDFGIYPDDGTDNDVQTITSITAVAGVTVTVTSHPFSTGNLVYFYDVGGMTEINGKVFEVEKVTADAFGLVGVDGSKYTSYTSGGSCIRKEVSTKYSNGYTYDVPSDCMRPIRIDDGTDGPGPDYIIIGVSPNQRILTTEKDAVLIYTSQVTDPDVYSSRFINAVASGIAMKLVVPLKKKGADLEAMTGFYQFHMQQGTLMDYREVKKSVNKNDPWLTDAGLNQ